MDPDELGVLSGAESGIIAADEQGRVTFVNRAALAVMGRTIHTGQPLADLMPARLRERHREGFRRYVETGRSKLEGRPVRVPALRDDGTEQEIDLAIRFFFRPDGTRLAVASVSPVAGRPPKDLQRIESAFEARAYQLV